MRKMEQGARALIMLRDMILSGEMKAGQRLRELALVDQLNISRTPIRFALGRLADEGIVESVGGGFTVREFTRQEIREAIRLRGVIEGMAVRLAAERKTPSDLMPLAWKCIDELDEVLKSRSIDQRRIKGYLDINRRFHNYISELSDSFVVQRTLNHVCALPFASPNAFVMAQRGVGDIRETIFIAQQQHRSILEAIENRDGGRAEALAREHAELSLSAMRKVLQAPDHAELGPGLQLLRETSDHQDAPSAEPETSVKAPEVGGSSPARGRSRG
jgi:GntR family transcriptional regulator of vanillate catabolism